MPLLSFVLVVRDEQAYIEECATSILGQAATDVELVVDARAATRHAPALLEELGQRDPRLRVGAAPSGDYVWFIRPTDLVSGLAAVAERLRAEQPDVLVVHHSASDAVGNNAPGPLKKALQKAVKQGAGPLTKHRTLADAAREPASLIVRRELATDASLAGAWRALLAAERIAAHPAKALERRDRPNARPVAVDVFAEYEAVLRDSDRGEEVAGPMLRHLLDLLDRAPDRRAFFKETSRLYRLAGAPNRGRVSQLVARVSYTGYRLLERAREAKASRERRRRERAKAQVERGYRAQQKRAIDPDLALFAAYWFRGYSCNPRAIYEKAHELVPGMRGVWVVRQDGVDALPAGVEHVVAGTPEYFEAIARARFLV